MKGTYIIVIYLPENSKIKIGSLGILDFIKGYYLYIGSAMKNKGSTTLENRVRRHISSPEKKKLFWHIDYLLANKICVITHIYLIPSLNRMECILSKELFKATDKYIKNFGSSDCLCPSHLYYFTEFNGIESCIN
ncbi:MAG: GIY-YIG nuclease family protein [Candidatus Lokiarchaeota archaeon]|nr:GIY-YIG nuclease family protein [Candidatus Lokiarchaeota archaeon]